MRGHSMFAVSAVLGAVRSGVRVAAGRSAWDIVSTGKAELGAHAGVVSAVELADIQGQDFSAAPVVVLSSRLGGLEDIPPGVSAVITNAPVDLLSHIAIRARQMGVLLVTMPEVSGRPFTPPRERRRLNTSALNADHDQSTARVFPPGRALS